jgi:hypothetical protein
MKYDEEQLGAGTAAVRKYVDGAGYGGYVNDEKCREIAAAVLTAVTADKSDTVTLIRPVAVESNDLETGHAVESRLRRGGRGNWRGNWLGDW